MFVSLHSSPYAEFNSCEEVNQLTFFGARLPVFLHRITYNQLSDQTITRSKQEAKKLCFDAYNEWIDTVCGENGKLVTESVEFSEQSDGISLVVSVTCIEDIAKRTPFQFQNTDK